MSELHPFTGNAADAVASLHSKTLEGFLSGLGPRFLRKYYLLSVAIPDMFTVVCFEGNAPVGLVTGVSTVQGLLRRILSRDILWFVFFFLGYFITHPFQIVRAIQTLMYPGFSGNEPELLTLTVDEAYRGKGIGKKLFLVCAKEFASRGYSSFLISAYDQLPANGFYARMGCTLIRTFSFHGEKMNYYRYRISG